MSVDILCGELTGSDLVDGRGDRLFAEGITLFVGLLGDLDNAPETFNFLGAYSEI